MNVTAIRLLQIRLQIRRQPVRPTACRAFARGMGLLVNKDDLGFGDHSWRYSMLVRDGVITLAV